MDDNDVRNNIEKASDEMKNQYDIWLNPNSRDFNKELVAKM